MGLMMWWLVPAVVPAPVPRMATTFPTAAGPGRHAVHSHWAIGNPLHWVLDVTMNGDRRRNRTGHGPENPALLRRLALNVARIEPGRDAMRGKPKRAGWDDNFLPDMIRATKPRKPTS